MAVRHIDVIGERRAGQACANGADIDDLMRDAKPFCAGLGEVQLLLVALAVIEREQACEFMFRRHFVGKRNGVQSAGADDERFHILILVLTG